MAGSLHREPASYVAEKHDLVVLRQKARALVFTDLRHFGRVLFHEGNDAPAWWAKLPPALGSAAFDRAALGAFLARRKRTAIKPVLLMQERFPGIGNWMADEILWRARVAPTTLAGDLDDDQIAAIYRSIRHVVRASVEVMDAQWEYPTSWLFAHRWKDGGTCPRCRGPLTRILVGGRTTCSCRVCQPPGDTG
jgi:formamidopyrimidine-DNA glycosylase